MSDSVSALGPAEGESAAYLARAGVEVTAVDFSPVQVERAGGFWADLPDLTFVHAEACAYLDDELSEFDAVYSTWGAVWFTDPDDLFLRVRRRLAPGGVFGFSHREPATGQYVAQPMSGKWLQGRESELTVHRWQYSAQQWADILKRVLVRGIAAAHPARRHGVGLLCTVAVLPFRHRLVVVKGPAGKGLAVAEQGLRDLGLGEFLRDRLLGRSGDRLVALLRAGAGSRLVAVGGAGGERGNPDKGSYEGDACT
ncbi:class I SAM-dependent methyltransferase [Streptomyces sp. NPDC004232]|uniref:class I SAM-dependent methyltransferase n=1 Tax=Streptomyces sp. NPDC004232 TaxID=3154454 RepID=UPI0033A7CAA3